MATKKKLVKKIEPEISEKEIETVILDWINRHPNGFAFKVNTVGIWDPIAKVHRRPGRFTLKGTSDILGMWQEKFLAIEVKKPKGRISQEQKAFIAQIQRRGGIGFFAYSLDDVVKHLNYFDKNGACIVS